jgi:hypothetical protein
MTVASLAVQLQPTKLSELSSSLVDEWLGGPGGGGSRGVPQELPQLLQETRNLTRNAHMQGG